MSTKQPDESDTNEVSEMWRTYKQERAKKRDANRNASASMLEQLGIPFLARNAGAHLIIRFGLIWVDFWPGTGLWHSRRPDDVESRGIFSLIKWLEKHDWKGNLGKPEPSAKVETTVTGRIVDRSQHLLNTALDQQRTLAPKKVPALLQKPDLAPSKDSTPPWED